MRKVFFITLALPNVYQPEPALKSKSVRHISKNTTTNRSRPLWCYDVYTLQPMNIVSEAGIVEDQSLEIHFRCIMIGYLLCIGLWRTRLPKYLTRSEGRWGLLPGRHDRLIGDHLHHIPGRSATVCVSPFLIGVRDHSVVDGRDGRNGRIAGTTCIRLIRRHGNPEWRVKLTEKSCKHYRKLQKRFHGKKQ